jgi:DNA-binding response OmpR family regulator
MRILLVEDEQQIADFLAVSLHAEGFSVDIAGSGRKGLELALANTYDLMVLDNKLPGKSGLDICREVRNQGQTCPIIMLSVLSDTNMKVSCLDAGADDYLIKPFSLQELISRVRALLRRPKRIAGEILTLDDLVLDTVGRVVRRGKKEIRLTRKEFNLLEYLMKHEDTAVTRGMIVEKVWDSKTDPYSNTIESHIVTLRKKIDPEKRRRLLHTVPGVGYKFGFNP